jgi:hypothetical protein
MHSSLLDVVTATTLPLTLGQFFSGTRGKTLEKKFMIFFRNKGMVDYQDQCLSIWVAESRSKSKRI